ncbi:MAG: hypothetical protein WDA37_12845 [Dysgonamonadaceae bacterium]
MRQKSLIQSIKWLLPLLFIFFINGKIFFTHNHLENNSIVVHSHPFKKGEKTTHNHTPKELIAIEFHTHGYSTDTIVSHIEINSPFFTLVQHDYIRQDKIFLSEKINSKLLRAPPHHS